MAEEGSVIKLTHWKLRRAGIFSLTPLTLFSSLSLFHSLSHSLSLSQINLIILHSYTIFTLVINSIELIWTSAFQKYFSLIHSAQVMSHISTLSHIHLWLSGCATWLGLFFCPFFRSHHERANYHITSSEWVRINYWALARLYSFLRQ